MAKKKGKKTKTSPLEGGGGNTVYGLFLAVYQIAYKSLVCSYYFPYLCGVKPKMTEYDYSKCKRVQRQPGLHFRQG